MRLTDDLPHPRWMYLKAWLFLFAGVLSGAALLAESPHLRTAFLLAIALWSFCRLYYFLFYVIERYIDPSFRFDGIGSALRYIFQQHTGTRFPPKTPPESPEISLEPASSITLLRDGYLGARSQRTEKAFHWLLWRACGSPVIMGGVRIERRRPAC